MGQVGGPEGAAAHLGMKRTTLQSWMRKLNIARQTFMRDLRERDRLENIDEEIPAIQHNFEEIIGNSAAMKLARC